MIKLPPLSHTVLLTLLLVLPTSTSGLSLTTKPKVAIVTGASRGIGRGIALELGSAGYTVYTLGRSSRTASLDIPFQRDVDPSLNDLTVESAAEAVTARGGCGVALPCNLGEDGAFERALKQVREEQDGRLDLLVCSAFTTPPSGLRDEFWKQGMEMWDDLNGLGLRQVYAACVASAPVMIDTAATASTPPLICLVSSFGGKSYTFNVAYGVGKAAIDRLAADMAYQLKKYGVATISLYPGLVQTEANLQMVEDGTWDEASGNLDLSTGETPFYSGRAVAKLASLGKDELMKRSGSVQVVAELAMEMGFTDVDGSRPASIRSLQYLLPNFVFKQIEEDSGKSVPQWLKNNVPDYLLPWSVFAGGPPPERETKK